MVEFLFLLLILAAISAAFPAWIGLRLAGLVVVLAFVFLIFMPVPYDPDWAYDLAVSGFMFIAVVVLLGIAARAAYELMRHGRIRPPTGFPSALRGLNGLLAFLAGVPLGGLISLSLGSLLTGYGPGLAIHAAVIVLCLIAGLSALQILPNPSKAIALGALVTVILATGDAMRLPSLIEAKAAAIRPEAPRCLMLGPDREAPMPGEDLMGLTVQKPVRLLIQDGETIRLWRWSFRGHGFVKTTIWPETPTCTPSQYPPLP
jgi:hypothetical protein